MAEAIRGGLMLTGLIMLAAIAVYVAFASLVGVWLRRARKRQD
jgi:hypothetical protein